jgi:hypothetical protein
MRMTIREHAARAVDYAIRVALISIVIVPIWFCFWWFIGFPPGGNAPELDATSARVAQILGIIGFVFVSPAYLCFQVLEFLHIPSEVPFGLLYVLAAILSVPAFWGTLAYFVGQSYRHARLSHHRI